MSTRTYTKDSLKVFWQPDLCTHCESCWRGLPTVFKPNDRPWVQLDGASNQQIYEQVTQCPSGALSILQSQEVVNE